MNCGITTTPTCPSLWPYPVLMQGQWRCRDYAGQMTTPVRCAGDAAPAAVAPATVAPASAPTTDVGAAVRHLIQRLTGSGSAGAGAASSPPIEEEGGGMSPVVPVLIAVAGAGAAIFIGYKLLSKKSRRR